MGALCVSTALFGITARECPLCIQLRVQIGHAPTVSSPALDSCHVTVAVRANRSMLYAAA